MMIYLKMSLPAPAANALSVSCRRAARSLSAAGGCLYRTLTDGQLTFNGPKSRSGFAADFPDSMLLMDTRMILNIQKMLFKLHIKNV